MEGTIYSDRKAFPPFRINERKKLNRVLSVWDSYFGMHRIFSCVRRWTYVQHIFR